MVVRISPNEYISQQIIKDRYNFSKKQEDNNPIYVPYPIQQTNAQFLQMMGLGLIVGIVIGGVIIACVVRK